MAFVKNIGNLLKKTTSSNPSLLQTIRCMSSSKLFIGGLSYNTDDQSLREAFTGFGQVIEARVILDRETGRSRGFGFVTFTSSEEASAAISGMDGKDLHGRWVRVNYATDRPARSPGGFGGGGFGGGGGYGGGGDGYGGGGGYGGSGGGYGGGGYGGSGGGGGYGGSGGSYGGDNYNSGSGSYGGGGSGGISNDSYASGGGAGGGYGGGTGYGSGSADVAGGTFGGSSNRGFADAGSFATGGSGSGGADKPAGSFEDDFGDDMDDDDQPEDYANKRS